MIINTTPTIGFANLRGPITPSPEQSPNRSSKGVPILVIGLILTTTVVAVLYFQNKHFRKITKSYEN